MLQVRARGSALTLVLFSSCVANPDFHGPMPVRNQHPAQLTVLHLPTTGAGSLPAGQVLVRGDAAYSNLFLVGSSPGGTRWVMDGEYLRAATALRAGLGNGLELGVELPFAHTSGGFLDGFVIGYHDALGFPDQGRNDTPRDQFAIEARRAGQPVWAVERDSLELLDVPAWLTWQVVDPAGGFGIAVRCGAELPTGDDRRGYGNGQMDWSAGLVLEARLAGAAVHGQVQHTLAGTPKQSRDAGFAFADVTSASCGAELPLDTGLSALLQVEWETSTLRQLDLDEVGRQQVLLWIGGRVRIDDDTHLELGFGEDLAGLVSPDFTAWLGMSWTPGRSQGTSPRPRG